jgi:transposase
MVHAACWAHARRKFFQAVELNPKDQQAIGIVAQMDKLFEIDRKARERGLSREDRHALRLSNNCAENAMRPIALGRSYEQSGIRQSC